MVALGVDLQEIFTCEIFPLIHQQPCFVRSGFRILPRQARPTLYLSIFKIGIDLQVGLGVHAVALNDFAHSVVLGKKESRDSAEKTQRFRKATQNCSNGEGVIDVTSFNRPNINKTVRTCSKGNY
jgi:hypothetical protein